MKGKRRRHDPEFKARVALEAIKGVKTIQEIAKEFDVHPVQVSEWKKTMAKNAASAFGAGAGKTDAEEFEQEASAAVLALHFATLRCVLVPPLRLPDFESLATPTLIQNPCSPTNLPHPSTIA